MILALLISLVTSLFFIAMGILFGSICNEKSIGGIASIMITGQSILSGMWFPVEGLSKGMIGFMNVLPFRNASILIQNAMNRTVSSFEDFLMPLLIVLAYTVAAFVTAILVFKKKMTAI